jgi:hypothetical protein
MLRRIAVIFAAVALLSGPLRAQSPDNIERATRDSIQRLDLQTDLVDKAAKDSIRSLDLQTEFPRQVEPVRIPIPQELIWLALICAAALIAYSMRDSLMNLLRLPNAGWVDPADAPGAAAAASEADALAAADRLSRDGNFVEAMHVLLLHSLAEIRRQLGERFADSLTSREILRVARLTPPGRTSLREIVAAVERTYFGAYPAQASDYASCRQNFETLQQTLRGAPA